MQDIVINKFIQRLNLPKNFTFITKNFFEIKNEQLYNKYSNNMRGNKTLELYHTVRAGFDEDEDVNKIYNNIIDNGFFINYSNFNNKEMGIYMANHGRYSWLWGSCSKNRRVIICHVAADSDLVQRYKSEIYSEVHDSEYVIKDPKIVYPKYILEYEIISHNKNSLNIQAFVKHGNFNCQKCDKKVKRCDCLQYPIFDEKDFI